MSSNLIKKLRIKYRYSYIVTIQFLGFRFHGWQKQLDVKTIHDSIDKTLSFVFKHTEYKTIGVGRLDAMVSAFSYPFQLFIHEDVSLTDFVSLFNKNCPSDFKCLHIKACATTFAIINAPKIKTYHYYFSFGEKQHPYAAPFVSGFNENIDIELMQHYAKYYEGTHHFKKYCCKPTKNTQFLREITHCEITKSADFKASFFPENTYLLQVKGSGFLRYQIRYMMAVLVKLACGEMTADEFKASLRNDNDGESWSFIAPQSGLHLHNIEFIS